MASTLLQLRTRALDACDMTNSGFAVTTVGTGAVDEQINASLARLYDLILDHDYEAAIISSALSFIGAVADCPTDFYKVIKVIWEESSESWYPLSPMSFHNMDVDRRNGGTVTDNSLLKYKHWVAYRSAEAPPVYQFKNQILLSNTPLSGGTFRLYYAPILRKMTADIDVLPILIPMSWEDYIVYDVAAYLLGREESDPSTRIMMREQAKQAILAACKSDMTVDSCPVFDIYRRFE